MSQDRVLFTRSFVESARAIGAQTGKPLSQVLAESRNAIFSDEPRNGKILISSAEAVARSRSCALFIRQHRLRRLHSNLPRLALLLRGIGDEAALVVARDARSDLARMFGRMAQAHALGTALENGGDNPRPDLVGLHRTRYDEVGHLDLIGAAAWPWRTASGYEGLTVRFWDPSAKKWHSWTESRPRHQLAAFKPTARYTPTRPVGRR